MFEIDIEEEMKYLCEVTGCSEEEAYAVMDAEDDFLDTKDLNESAEDVDAAFSEVDVDEMLAYIMSKTGMTKEEVVTILAAEEDFIEEFTN